MIDTSNTLMGHKRKRAECPPINPSQSSQLFLKKLPREIQIHLLSYLTLNGMLMAIVNHQTKQLLVGKGLLHMPQPNGIIPDAYRVLTQAQSIHTPLSLKTEETCLRLGAIPRMPYSVDLRACTATDQELIEKIARYPHLQMLNLDNQFSLTNTGFSHLANLVYLRKLLFMGSRINTTTLSYLEKLPLQELTISSHSTTNPQCNLTPLISLSSTLTHLTLTGRKITKEDMLDIKNLSSLTHLSLENCDIDADVDLGLLSALPLKSLNLSRCKSIRLETLSHLPLESLDLANCQDVTDEILEQISRLPLKTLKLNGCSNITDVGLGYLSQLHLRSLNLNGCCNITDVGLSQRVL